MTLEQLAKETQEFIQEALEVQNDYVKHSDDLNKKVKAGLKGSVEVLQELGKMKDNITEDFYSKAVKLQEKIEVVRNEEIKNIEKHEDPITSDALAELTLLSELELSKSDLENYVEKYKYSPLALKRIREISHKNNIFVDFPKDRKEHLNTTLGRIDNHITRFKSPRLDGGVENIKTTMVAEGAIKGIKEDVAFYKSL